MIKTEYYDENYNEVDPEDATLIVQILLDESGNIQKKIEWSQKKKTGYFTNISEINSDVNYRYLSQSMTCHHLEIASSIQRIIDHLWHYHAVSKDNSEKYKILATLNGSYEQLRHSLSHVSFEHERERKGGRI
ncbi:MAG: hypothetical protein H8D35_03025 [Nitrosopumilus sp.]|nr:hypothetical protein [Nitrosopumilus sp.]